MTDRAALLDAGRAYLERWNVWLRENPDANADMVKARMERGELPPVFVDRTAGLELSRETRREAIGAQLEEKLQALTTLQRRFVVNFLSGTTNVTQAYRDAGGTAKHADRAAHVMRWLPNVQAVISAYLQQQEMGVIDVIARLSEQARAGYAEYLKTDTLGKVTVDLPALLAAGKGHLIKGVKETRYGQVIEFYPADAALDRLMRYHGAYNDKVTVTWQQEIIDLLRAGQITREQVAAELPDLAGELFRLAGVAVERE